MMTTRLALTLFIVFLFHFAEAQYSISGKVTGIGDGPMNSAAVELKAGDNMISTIQTDSTGFFNFPASSPGNYHLRVTHISHQSFDTTFHLEKHTFLTIHLSAAQEQLQGVSFTGAIPVIE
jgi:hypothetical protein